MLTRYVRAVVGATDAEDVTQDVQVSVFRKLWTLTTPDLFRPWTYPFGIMAMLSETVWIVFVIGAERASEKQLILMARVALACTVFGGVFLLVLVIFRMAHKVLQAIELSGRRA